MDEYREVLSLSREELVGRLRNHPLELAVMILNIALFIATLGMYVSLRTETATQSPTLIQKKQTESSTEYIDIGGAVVKPGVYALKSGRRVFELLEEAGGLSPGADLEYFDKNINRAQKLNDQEKIYLPFLKQRETTVDVPEPSSTLTSINSADGSSLEELPGIGPVTAAAIISSRPYSSLNDLLTKKIVKSAAFEKIKKLITL